MNLPHVVVEQGPDAVLDARAELMVVGWTVVDVDLAAPPAWPGPGADPVVVAGRVATAEEAAHAVLAAVAGRGALLEARAPRDVVDRMCEDLRRLGHLDHRVGPGQGVLEPEQHRLLALLAQGVTLGEAARRLHLSRRSADRRLAAARQVLGAGTTGAAVAAHRRRLERLPRPPAATVDP